jgi:hypothetical protein
MKISVAFERFGLHPNIERLSRTRLVLSRLPSHLVPIPSITCCVFNPLLPSMCLSVIVCCQCLCTLCSGVRRVMYPCISLFCIRWVLIIKHSWKHSFALLRLTSLPPGRTPDRVRKFQIKWYDHLKTIPYVSLVENRALGIQLLPC